MNLNILYVDRGQVVPNPWNPNKQDDFIYEKELASIKAFGFVDPILCRTLGSGWEIIDGEHRWRAAGDLGINQVPIIDLGEVEEDEAKQLTIVLNETRGRPDPGKLRALLGELASRKSVTDLLQVLPYTREQFDGLVKPFDWDSVERPRGPVGNGDGERWVLRSYRLPVDVAGVLDEALGRIERAEGIPEWRALEMLAADFLGR